MGVDVLWEIEWVAQRDTALSAKLSEPLRDSLLPDISPACPREKPQISPLRFAPVEMTKGRPAMARSGG
jgi:hypothetical protein